MEKEKTFKETLEELEQLIESNEHTQIIEYYRKYYPEGNIDEETHLFSWKSGNPLVKEYLDSISRPYTRKNLCHVLGLCTVEQIDRVGW